MTKCSAAMLTLQVLAFIAVVERVTGAVGDSTKVFPSPIKEENDQHYWLELGRNEIDEAVNRPLNNKVAKNVILFLGDGMGITVSTAGRIFKGQRQGHSGEEGYLVWEKFPNVGLLKTYCVDKQVPDSAATATAYLAGVKSNYYTIGVNSNVKYKDCSQSLKKENRLTTMLDWAQEADKDTGLVTNTYASHASVAGLYAKVADRDWYCDSDVIKDGKDPKICKDISRQLIEDEPGRDMKVIMGGGRQMFGEQLRNDTKEKCRRSDGRNLLEEWRKDKEDEGESYAYVTNTRELRSIDPENTEYIMGLFHDLHLPYETERDKGTDGIPSLDEMTEVAIKRLRRSENGFFLMVEGGKIDKALHLNLPRKSLEELVVFEKAVERALTLVDLEETLIIVTADHSHALTLNGYPKRGNNILGIVNDNKEIADDLPYTTLLMSTGHSFDSHYLMDGDKAIRKNLTGVDTTDKEFESPTMVPTFYDEAAHSGEDVAAYAIGPMAHLFHRLHEQTHVAYVMAYASCVGPFKECDRQIQIPKNKYEIVQQKIKAQELTEDEDDEHDEHPHQGIASVATTRWLGFYPTVLMVVLLMFT